MSEEKKSKPIKLCGLWQHKTQDGKVFYSGKLSYGSQLLVFKNEYKEEDAKKPDLIVYLSEYKKKEKKEQEDDKSWENEEEIPF